MAVVDVPLLRPADLDAVRRPLESARNLPGALYVRPEVLALERDEIFARMWVCVGRRDEIANPGDFLTAAVGGRSVLVVRGDDGEVRAFLNVCRHRGSCLVRSDCGNQKTFRCQYHGWTYGRDGALRAAPLMNERAGFRAEDEGLIAVRTESWGGFLFVNLDPDAPALDRAMRGFPDLDRYRLGDLRRTHRLSYEVGANWKAICENYSECYHCALVHPQLNRLSDYRSGGEGFAGENFNGGPMAVNEGADTLSMSGGRRHPEIEGITERDRRQIHYFHFYPTFLIAFAPDYVIVHRVEPLAADRSQVLCDLFYPPKTIAHPDFDPAETVEFWDVTNRQDWELCEMVQGGAGAGVPPGPYHPLEACVHSFDSWYVERLGKRLSTLRA